jgi:tellurite resistance protein TerC
VDARGPLLDRHVRVLHWLRRGIVFGVGCSVLLLGVVMIVTPGPAFLVIPLGLAILATEFLWARRALRRIRDHLRSHGVDPTPKSPRLRRLLSRLGWDDDPGRSDGAAPGGRGESV